MRLKYVGSTPVTFVSLGLEVYPDDEFSVPDDDSLTYTSRSDVIVAKDPKTVVGKPSKTRRSTAEEPATVDRADSTEESDSDVEPNAI